MPFFRGSSHPDPGIKPGSPELQADSLPSEPPGKPEEGRGTGKKANFWPQSRPGRKWGICRFRASLTKPQTQSRSSQKSKSYEAQGRLWPCHTLPKTLSRISLCDPQDY